MSPPPSAAALDATPTEARSLPIARRQTPPGVPHSIARPAAVAAATATAADVGALDPPSARRASSAPRAAAMHDARTAYEREEGGEGVSRPTELHPPTPL